MCLPWLPKPLPCAGDWQHPGAAVGRGCPGYPGVWGAHRDEEEEEELTWSSISMSGWL